jgi:hypothetical protein
MALIRTDATQLVTFTQQMTDPRWLGQIGHVTNLTYSWVLPGGCDQLSATLAIEPTVRTEAMNPGRIVQAFRGGALIWEGIMTEPVPGTAGWALSAVGAGNYGTNYVAVYTDTWPSNQPDESINNAIGRGMRWQNPGQDSVLGLYLPQTDPGSASQTITDLLNLVTTYGGLTWLVRTGIYGNQLSVFPLPSAVTHLLVVTTPQARTLGGDVNTIFEKYTVTADNSTTGAAEVDGITSSSNAASIAAYGALESYIDLTQAGVMPQATAQGFGNSVLNRFLHASWAGPITVGPYSLLTPGGQPVDIAAVPPQPMVVQLVLTDFGYGGEVALSQPVWFLVGSYAYDDTAQTAQIASFNYLGLSMSSLLSAASTTLPTATTS